MIKKQTPVNATSLPGSQYHVIPPVHHIPTTSTFTVLVFRTSLNFEKIQSNLKERQICSLALTSGDSWSIIIWELPQACVIHLCSIQRTTVCNVMMYGENIWNGYHFSQIETNKMREVTHCKCWRVRIRKGQKCAFCNGYHIVWLLSVVCNPCWKYLEDTLKQGKEWYGFYCGTNFNVNTTLQRDNGGNTVVMSYGMVGGKKFGLILIYFYFF